MSSAQVAVKMNVLDRAIAVFDPEAAARRYHARATLVMAESALGGSTETYAGASRKRRSLAGWVTSLGSAAHDIAGGLSVLRARSRDLVRNNPIARGALKTVTLNAVGTGLSLKPEIDARALGLTEEQAQAWQADTLARWKVLAESVDFDAARRLDFYGLQKLAFFSTMENGDTFALLPNIPRVGQLSDLRVQLIEADRVCNPPGVPNNSELVNGIKLGLYGEPVACCIRRGHPGDFANKNSLLFDWREMFGAKTGRRNVLHLMEHERIGQPRGVPYLAAVIEPLRQLARYTEAELTAAVVSGLFTVFIKTTSGDSFNTAADQVNAAAQNPEMELGAGAVLTGQPGDEIQTINPGRPNTGFDPFIQAVLRQIGMALGLPFEVLIKHYTASYTAARAAILDAWRFFKERRDWLAANFCQPIYETWLDGEVAAGRIRCPGYFANPLIRKAWRGALWIGDGMPAIDPLKEANAAEKRLAIGVSNLAKECMAHDADDWERNHNQQVREKKARLQDGLIDPPPAVAAPADPGEPEQEPDKGGSDTETPKKAPEKPATGTA